MEYIEVVANNDDGVEFFGGTVNTCNIVVAFANDDSFDIDQGHTGTHQFWFAIQNPNAGDNLGEWDGIDGAVKDAVNGTDVSAEGEPANIVFPAEDVVASAPQIYNATLIGPGAAAAAVNPSGSGKDNGIYFDDSFNGALRNSIVHDSKNFLASFAGDGVNDAKFESNIVGDFGPYTGSNTSVLNGAPTNFYVNFLGAALDNNTDAGTDPAFGFYERDGSDFLVAIDPRSSAVGVLDETAPKPAPYYGAFGSENWALGWTWMDANGYFATTPAGGELTIIDCGFNLLDPDVFDITLEPGQTASAAYYSTNLSTWTQLTVGVSGLGSGNAVSIDLDAAGIAGEPKLFFQLTE